MASLTHDQIQSMIDETGMTSFMGVKVVEWDETNQKLTLKMPMRDELQGGAGQGHMHGGAIGSLIDTAATFVFIAAGVEQCPTANYRIDFMRPVVNSSLTVTATIRRRGRTLGVSDADAFDDAGKLVATGRATFVMG